MNDLNLGYEQMPSGLILPIQANMNFNITSAPVSATTRALKTSYSIEAAEELIDMWGPKYPTNALDVLTDALDDPAYDPNKPYYGRPRWSNGRLATPQEIAEHGGTSYDLVKSMAEEMCKEIDAEIAMTLATKTRRTKTRRPKGL